MFNDEGLGAAMAQAAVEQKADDLQKRVERIESRQLLIYQVLAEVLSPAPLNYLMREWNRQ